MIKKLLNWFCALPIITYNAIFNFIMGGRNIGKTWAFKRRTFRRALKKGKKTIWVRRTKQEAHECALSFYESKDLQEFCGIDLYDKNSNPNGNVKANGRRIYIKRGGRWVWFVRVIALSEWKVMRSADDINCDTIIFDEFTTTPEKYALYRGNEAQDFIDLFISIMRKHEVKCFLLGNKESVSNPIMKYFKIPVIPLKWQGIKLFKHNTIAVQQINDGVKTGTVYEERVKLALQGTQYGDYLEKAQYKNQPQIIIKPPPANTTGYIQLYWRGNHIKIWQDTAARSNELKLYVGSKNDLTSTIFTDTWQRLFKKQVQLQKKRHKDLFRLLEQCVSDNRIAYNNYNDYENIIPFFKWLGIAN